MLDMVWTLWYTKYIINALPPGGSGMGKTERSMKKKLWNKDFVLLLQGNAVSTIGDVMYSVAIAYWVYQSTGSSALMGVMTSISMFVTMFLSPFCGSIVDKCNRKWVIVCIDTFQGLMMLGVGVLAYMNSLSVPIVIVAALLASFGSVFYSPAISTLMLDIIPRDDMVRGQSIHSGAMSLIDLAGTALSGALVAFLGVPLIVVINGISNLYSAFTEMLVTVPKTVQEGESVTVKGVLRDSASAVKTIFSNGCLKLFVPGALIINLLMAGPLTLMLPFCMEKGFSVDMYGYLLAVYSAASLIAVALLGVIKLKPSARFRMMSFGFTLSTACYILLYFSSNFIMACAMAFLAAILNSVGNAIFNAALMLALPEENRSAMLGFIHAASVGGVALSALIYGALGEIFPLYIIFSIGTLLSVAPTAFVCFHRRIRKFVLENS